MNHLVGIASDAGIQKILTPGEAEALAQFRSSFMSHADADASATPVYEIDPDSLPESGWRALDDTTLLRFLRADVRSGKFRQDVSLARLHHALQWRKKMRSDALIANPPPNHDDYCALRIRRYTGFDKQGRAVQFERLGQFLASGNSKAFSDSEWLTHYARDMETIMLEMRKAAQQVGNGVAMTEYLFVGDLGGVGGIWRHLGSVIPLLKLLTKEIEVSFPEIVGNIVLINAPRIFSSIFPMVKAFMDPITASKIHVYSHAPTEKLLDLMPPSALPIEYGGELPEEMYPATRIANAKENAVAVS